MNDSQPGDSGISIQSASGDLTVGGDAVGRDKIVSIGNLTIQQFVRGELLPQQQLEFFVQQIGLTNAPPSYALSQYEAYCRAWRSLQAVRLTGEDLWEGATVEKLLAFSEALKQASLVIGDGEIFFEPQDADDLRQLLGALGWFTRGKGKLIALRSIESGETEADYYRHHFSEIQEQIQENHRYKEAYEQLVTRVRDSFRIRLQDRPK